MGFEGMRTILSRPSPAVLETLTPAADPPPVAGVSSRLQAASWTLATITMDSQGKIFIGMLLGVLDSALKRRPTGVPLEQHS